MFAKVLTTITIIWETRPYFSQSGGLFKSQLLTLIRIVLLNINFNVGVNNC